MSRAGKRDDLYVAKIRHDLERLWLLAVEEGLEIEAKVPAWIGHLAKTHRKPYKNRYSEDEMMVIHPDQGTHCKGLSKLLTIIASSLEKPRSQPAK